MKCVILAAGEGKRMHPLTFTRPKVMLPLVGKPILEWNLMNAKAAGFKKFLFVVGYKSEMVRDYFKNGKDWSVSIDYVNQGKALGTAHAISMAEPFVDDCLVLCGDTIFGVNDIKNVAHKKMGIGLVNVEHAEEYGVVALKGSKVTQIYEKMEHPTSNTINAGIYRFKHTIFSYIKKTKKSLRGEYEITDSINQMIVKEPLEGVFLHHWLDVVYPWHLLDANEELLKTMKTKLSGTVEKYVMIHGPVTIGKQTVIRSGTYIEGPVNIGENCRIGPNCYIRPFTSIGNNCHIGNACEIKNSIIMDHSNVPHQNYVGDSIIGEQCNLGAGTKIANLRLDKNVVSTVLNGKTLNTGRKKFGAILGDNIQTGINTSINTGTIIGTNCFLGPGALVKGTIRPDSTIL